MDAARGPPTKDSPEKPNEKRVRKILAVHRVLARQGRYGPAVKAWVEGLDEKRTKGDDRPCDHTVEALGRPCLFQQA